MKHQQTETQPAPKGAARAKPGRSARKGNGEVGITSDNSREALIRQRAYFLYEARQFEDGHELEDWLLAEAQVSQQAPGQPAG